MVQGHGGGASSTARRRELSSAVHPGGGTSAAHPSTAVDPYTCPRPAGTLFAKARSTSVCQNVIPGYHRMSGDTSGPRGSSSHRGGRISSSGLNQTIGSEEFCRYTTLGRGPANIRR